jgi:spermidine synthase
MCSFSNLQGAGMHKTLDVETKALTGSGLVLLLATTIFVSAFLLFQVQPLISKFILPWFGGSPAVWTTAMLFFQCVLFGGYLYSHLTSTYLGLQRQTQLHIVLLLAASIMAIFVIPMDALKPAGDENPTLKILMLLGTCVGLPYFMLSTTGPLIQAWFSRAYPGASPYRLFALSNFGSLLALASFPFLFEPNLELPQMGKFWMYGFWIFAGLCIYTGIRILGMHLKQQKNATVAAVQDSTDPPQWWHKIAWLLLPAVASMVFIATSNEVTHNVAPTPFLWIAPLGLYLITFIICFDHERWYMRTPLAVLCALLILVLVSYDSIANWAQEGYQIEIKLSYAQSLVLYFATMFLMCMVCHGEFVKLRPRHHKYLTEYYLFLSAGGALGGLFISFVATNFFADYYEWPLGLLICFALAGAILFHESKKRMPNSLQPAFVVGAVLAGLLLLSYQLNPFEDKANVLFKARNFYGTVAVLQDIITENQVYPGITYDKLDSTRIFRSGTIKHGQQFIDPERRKLPIAYYHKDSGSGQAINYVLSQSPDKPIKYAVVGLGAGSLAAFARPAEGSRAADECVTYEINPLVERIAREYFWYLPDYEERTGRKCEVRLGDARLTMEREEPQNYDIIFLDAFSGDSVPAHLLTREAFEIYKKHLRKDAAGNITGYIVLNITNSYLNLYPVVKNAAEQVMKMKYTSVYRERDRKEFAQRTHYFIMSNDEGYLKSHPMVKRQKFKFVKDQQGNEEKIPTGETYDYDWPGIPLWTDHYSNLFTILLKD